VSTRRRVSARQRRRLLIATCTTLTIGLAFGVAISQVLLAQNQDRLDKLNQRVTVAQQRYEKLRYQVAEAESPERIVAAAHNRLGMIEPDKVNYVPPVVDNTVEKDEHTTDAPDWRLVKAELAKK
jgi:cell division protein FtsL